MLQDVRSWYVHAGRHCPAVQTSGGSGCTQAQNPPVLGTVSLPPTPPPTPPYRALHSQSFPGTSMMSLGNCLEPQCQKCEDDEYQDKFTKESKCLLQTYCDASKSGAAGRPWLPCCVRTFSLSSPLPQTETSSSPSTTSLDGPPARAETASTAPPASASPVCGTRPANRDTESNLRVSGGAPACPRLPERRDESGCCGCRHSPPGHRV